MNIAEEVVNKYWLTVNQKMEVFKKQWDKERKGAPTVPARIIEAAKRQGFTIIGSKLY